MQSQKFCDKDRTFIKEKVEVAKRFCLEFFSNQNGIDCVLLTGSVARGDCNEGRYGYSIDICVIFTDCNWVFLPQPG